MKLKLKQLFLGLLCLTIFLEAASFCALSIADRRLFSFSRIHELQDEIAAPVASKSEQALFGLPTVPHPYLGYVNSPDVWVRNATHLGYDISNYGFFDKHPAVMHKKRNRVVIGIFGGSVAWWFSSMGEEAFLTELRQSPRFRGKDIELVRVALSAYKQPQQLLALSYLLSIGAHFDYIISLDGFNEVALPATGNLAKSVNPFFPHYWDEIFQHIGAEELEPEQLRIKLYESWRKKWASEFTSGWLRWTVTGNTIWHVLDSCLLSRMQKLRELLQQKQPEKQSRLPFAIRGPVFDAGPETNVYRRFARVWERGALTMEKICEGMGITYLHFLQPNQYVPNSKPLSKQELEQAYSPEIFWRHEVLKGYPELIQAGQRLGEQGVNYHDLTMLFRNTAETVYADNCCHLTAEGNAILARTIADEVILAQNSKPAARAMH